MRNRSFLIVSLWSTLLAGVICAPFFWPGFVLSYDMVWVPTWDLDRAEWWGMGDALPRAVPSDAVLALVTLVIPAQIAQPLIVTASLALAGMGVGRLVRGASLLPQLAAVTLYVWNPFVAERLVLGHWPLLVAYAALPWLVVAIRDPRRIGLLVATLAAMAITPVTGVMSVVVGLVLGRRDRWMRILSTALALNAPWIVAGVLHVGSLDTDADAVRLFDVQAEGYLGRLGSALSLGGVWNTDVVPESRTLVTAVIVAIVLWGVMIVGAVSAWRRDARETARVLLLAAIGLIVALSGWIATDLMVWLFETVPGAAMLRDGTRWLMLLALLQAVLFAAGLQAIARRVGASVAGRLMVAALMLLPIGVLPDLAWGAGGRLEAVEYPDSWHDAREAISDSSVRGDIVVLPFEAYRAPPWNDGRPVLDPAGRFFDRRTVTNDSLLVSDTEIPGENPRATRVAEILEGDDVEAQLADEGIGVVVEAPPGPDPLEGDIIVDTDEIRVLTIDRASGSYIPGDQMVGMGIAWGLVFVAAGTAFFPVRSPGDERWAAEDDATPT